MAQHTKWHGPINLHKFVATSHKLEVFLQDFRLQGHVNSSCYAYMFKSCTIKFYIILTWLSYA